MEKLRFGKEIDIIDEKIPYYYYQQGRSEMPIYHETMGDYGNLNLNILKNVKSGSYQNATGMLPKLLPECYQKATR